MKLEYKRKPKTVEIKGIVIEVPKRTTKLQEKINCILKQYNNEEITAETSVINSFKLFVSEDNFVKIFPDLDDIDLDELIYYNDELIKLFLSNLPK